MSTANTTTTTKCTTIFNVVEEILKLAKNSELNEEFQLKAQSSISFFAKKMGLTCDQALLLALFINFYNYDGTDIDDIREYVGCTSLRLLPMMSDIDVLVEKKMLQPRGNPRGLDEYRVSERMLRCVRENRPFVKPNYKCANILGVISYLGKIFRMRQFGYIDFKASVHEVNSLLNDNDAISGVRKLKSYSLEPKDLLLLLFYVYEYVNGSEMFTSVESAEYLFHDTSFFSHIRIAIRNSTHPLQTRNLLEEGLEDGMKSMVNMQLTDKARLEIFGEYYHDLQRKDTTASFGLTGYKTINKKQMFYTSRNAAQVDELYELLKEKNYKSIRKRMRKKGFRSGFITIFYGAPGTGKTETVMQMARQTKRDVMLVDIPSIKSKWVGESEKNIKAVFDRYRLAVKQSQRAPILLFNEADALLGIRNDSAVHSVDKMNNTMQNIILQEMESLDGIMIATTNLQQSMDTAFERRFLYKIRFDIPNAEVRAQLWQSMIPELPEEGAASLARRFNFSGGQIENVARKHAINSILHGDPDDLLESVRKICGEEILVSAKPRK